LTIQISRNDSVSHPVKLHKPQI